MNDIKYSKVLTAKGRNGLLKQTGLAITPNAEKDTLSLSPLTSKGGFTDSCWLEIPKESLPELLPVFSTDDLIAELGKRGYVTDLLFCLEDVKIQLNNFNAANDTQHTLDDGDMSDILSNCDPDMAIERFNDSIYTEVELFFQPEEEEE